MHYVRLGFKPAWWSSIQDAARDCGQTPEEFLLGVIAASCPSADRSSGRLPDDALLDGVRTLCMSLERLRSEILRSLQGLRPRSTPASYIKRQLQRRRVGDHLRAAMQRQQVRNVEMAG